MPSIQQMIADLKEVSDELPTMTWCSLPESRLVCREGQGKKWRIVLLISGKQQWATATAGDYVYHLPPELVSRVREVGAGQ